jgi:hypothetical protein
MKQLRRGANKVYAGTRSGTLETVDIRVTPVRLDVTNEEQIQVAVQNIEVLDILIK